MSHWTTADIPDLHGRIALVTGANSGLGLETTLALAAKGAVVMACRDQEKGRKVKAALEESVPGANLELAALDLSSLAGIRAFAEEFRAGHTQLDLLFNNAGVMAIPYRKTQDGFEWQFGTNYLGHFALTGLLLPTLLATPQSRVITTSSGAHVLGKIEFDNLNNERSYSRWAAYGKSKLADLMFAFELQRRLKRAGVDTLSVAAHPGFSHTSLQSTSATEASATMERLMYSLYRGQSAAMGALPQLYAATASSISGGEYIGPEGLFGLSGYPKKVRANKPAYNEQVAARLWEASVEMTGVDYAALHALSEAKV
jgi:NAD(P)-dependent dehydrogenase (short-subunit alcohol dehydrogenase family)